ncbi:hypothetical protein J2Z69_000275 [Paenibacillus shirakamiensis]|uniref:Uncharacterized protein n=1 Tax=Paenibacillus shirakamiensis TaxID=1265935 RepID=A0ABS4JE74_9BACL|nr:hypothetical protein [Paenibacillus shirakamiensis]MBP1999256.1 hypothetical protein [Paenibacillus shirakamiensis]
MHIDTNEYKVAQLQQSPQALELLQKTEEAMKELTGRTITLIAYQKSREDEQYSNQY